MTSMSRRRWLRIGLGGSILLGLGGGLAWSLSGYSVPRDVASRLVALSAKEYRIVEAVAARILRRDADDLPTADEIEVALAIDAFVARLDDANRTDLLRLLQLVEHGLPIANGHASRFTRLDGNAQDAVLRAMESSSVELLRGGFAALKSLCVMSFFSHPLTWGAIGYDGPLVQRPAEGWVEAARLGLPSGLPSGSPSGSPSGASGTGRAP